VLHISAVMWHVLYQPHQHYNTCYHLFSARMTDCHERKAIPSVFFSSKRREDVNQAKIHGKAPEETSQGWLSSLTFTDSVTDNTRPLCILLTLHTHPQCRKRQLLVQESMCQPRRSSQNKTQKPNMVCNLTKSTQRFPVISTWPWSRWHYFFSS
jgi:hypothetical protein